MNAWLALTDHMDLSKSMTRPSTSCAVIEDLPGDILLEVASNLADRADRLHFALVCTRIYPQVLPSLYASVELCGPQQCHNTLTMLCNTPTLARHVQELVLYPDSISQGEPCNYEHSHPFCTAASFLVAKAALYMDALHTFSWHANWGSPIETMWYHLRRCCPNLKNLGFTANEHLPRSSSDLFAFNDLTSFSLTVKPVFFRMGHNFGAREYRPIYNRLWDMLTLRSPNLRSLVLDGSDCQEAIYAQRLLQANWPSLQSLELIGVKFDSHNPLDNAEEDQSLLGFLSRHTSLERLMISRVAVDLSQLSPGDLPKLKRFDGSLDYLRALNLRGLNVTPNFQFFVQNPHAQPVVTPMSFSLESLVLAEPMPLRELTPLAVSSMLVSLHALTSLTVVFSLESGYDSNGVFRTIASACPQLLHLDLSCTSKPSFYLEAFSRTLKSLTKLRTMSLTIVKVYGDEPMQTGAMRIALSNPRLTHFSISYITPDAHCNRRCMAYPPPVEEGHYRLVCDGHGIPLSLLVRESWRRFGGFGKRVTRRSVCELRPSGHPDAVRNGWPDVLFERSPAGEEARVLMLVAWLFGLTAWGVTKSLLSHTGATSPPWYIS